MLIAFKSQSLTHSADLTRVNIAMKMANIVKIESLQNTKSNLLPLRGIDDGVEESIDSYIKKNGKRK